MRPIVEYLGFSTRNSSASCRQAYEYWVLGPLGPDHDTHITTRLFFFYHTGTVPYYYITIILS